MENLTFSSADAMMFIKSGTKTESKKNETTTTGTTCLRDTIRTMMMRLYFFIVIDTSFSRLDKNGLVYLFIEQPFPISNKKREFCI